VTNRYLKADLLGDAEIREIQADIAKMDAKGDGLEKNKMVSVPLASTPQILTSTSPTPASDDVVLEVRLGGSACYIRPSLHDHPSTVVQGFMTIDKRHALPPASSAEYSKVNAGQNGCKGDIVKEEGGGLRAALSRTTTSTSLTTSPTRTMRFLSILWSIVKVLFQTRLG